MQPAIAKILESADGKRRILVVKRDHGNFGLRVERQYQNTYGGLTPGSIFRTSELDQRKAKATFLWLS
jgi:hypothetical protein